jgi:DNA-binding transcriptional MerR regulator
MRQDRTVRVHYNEITEWRCQGVSWAEIANRLDRPNPDSVRQLYRREHSRQISPQPLPIQSAPPIVESRSPSSSLRGQALQQLTDLHQRQVVEALADIQGLPDDHPVWATVTLLGAVIAKAGERSKMSAELTQALADAAHLNRQMPGFFNRLEEVLGSTQKTLASLEARVANIEARVN